MALAAGTRLGPYEVLDSLGTGGMGEVYRARDSRLGREVAVKVLPAKVAQEPRALERFEREARAAGQYVSAMFFTWGHAGLGDKEAALDWLEKAYDERNPLISFLNWPLLDNLRSEPRFRALLEKANIPHIDQPG